MAGITIAWLTNHILDWKYAIGGILIAAYPTSAIELVRGTIAAKLSSKK